VLAVEVELLAGRYVATAHDEREAAEWPPHPVRLVYALVAALGGSTAPADRAALEWLSAQEPPLISHGHGAQRSVTTSYVPVNDRAVPVGRTAAGTLPRGRQPRTFPTIVPDPPTVTYTWGASPEPEVRDGLARLAERVAYLGHSSSPVRVALVDDAPAPALEPADGAGSVMLRVPAPGLLEALDAAFERRAVSGVRGPLPCRYAGYREARPAAAASLEGSLFHELIMLRRLEGQPLPIAAVERAALALRDAVLAVLSDAVPEVISGHDATGQPSRAPHVAFLAFPDVGHPHAEGRLTGVGVALPTMDQPTRERLEAALRRLCAPEGLLRITRSVAWRLSRPGAAGEPIPSSLRPATWEGHATRWATATPVELDRFVDDRLGEEAEQVVAASAERVGLPTPERVVLTPVSALVGGGHWRDIRRRQDRTRRPLVHAILQFSGPVCGPVILGAGRYRGLGLCRPLAN